MKLAFVTSLLPVQDPVTGFDLANRVVVDAIREKSVDLKLIGYSSPGTEIAYRDDAIILGEQDITNARAGAAQKARWLLQAVANNTTVSSAKMLACGPRKIEEALAAAGPVDGLILNSVQLPAAYPDIFGRYKSIFIAHNVEWLSAFQNSAHAATRMERQLYRRESSILKRLEDRLCRQARFVWTLSEEDRHSLLAADAGRSAFLPLVTRFDPPEAPDVDRTVEYDVGMIGSWSWQSNRIGLDWFLDEVTPKLPQTMTIAIAGQIGQPTPVAKHPGLRLPGRVPDARDFVRSCGVIALASRAGTGVQLKTIETFEMGLPAVATSSALRGIADTPPNVVAVDAADEFAQALAEQVEVARKGGFATLDGRKFHAEQRRRLGEAIEVGLKRLDSKE
ncbi:glycosyltransferase family 4 protein [Hoeflea sp. CAU 1731]